MTLPSRRTILIGLGAFLGLSLVVAATWFWLAAQQREAMAAYATALVAAQSGSSSPATPESRAAAIRQLESVLSRYPSAPGAAQAALELGNLRYVSGSYEAARASWQIAVTRATASPSLRTLARAGIAQAWEADRNYPKAVEAYQSALTGLAPTDFLFEHLLLGLGRAQELAGQRTEAVATYRRLLADVPQPKAGEEIRARLLSLGES